jgi:type VI secretion system protein ImpH
VAGERVWDVSSKIRLRLGPMRLIQFLAFLPDKKPPIPGGRPSPSHKRYFFLLVHLTRLYLGPELDFEIQLVLQAREVPPCRMVKGEPNGARLGWDTWLLSEPARKDAEEAVFEGEELFELPSEHAS